MKLAIFFCLSMLLALPSHAANIDFAKHNTTERVLNFVLIEGDIEEGDFEKFVRFVVVNRNIGTVYLASRGGNLAEAMKIGGLIRELYLTTAAPMQNQKTWLTLQSIDNNVCTSSCFFLYAAGVKREGYEIGIHRPYLSPEGYKKMNLGAAKSGHDAILSIVSRYLEMMNVPNKYLDIMISTPSDSIYWISLDDINKDLNGKVPAIQEWMKANCKRVTKEDERNERAILSRIPTERRNLPMHQAITNPQDKETFDNIIQRREAQADCELNGLAIERKKALDKLAVKYGLDKN